MRRRLFELKQPGVEEDAGFRDSILELVKFSGVVQFGEPILVDVL